MKVAKVLGEPLWTTLLENGTIWLVWFVMETCLAATFFNDKSAWQLMAKLDKICRCSQGEKAKEKRLFASILLFHSVFINLCSWVCRHMNWMMNRLTESYSLYINIYTYIILTIGCLRFLLCLSSSWTILRKICWSLSAHQHLKWVLSCVKHPIFGMILICHWVYSWLQAGSTIASVQPNISLTVYCPEQNSESWVSRMSCFRSCGIAAENRTLEWSLTF